MKYVIFAFVLVIAGCGGGGGNSVQPATSSLPATQSNVIAVQGKVIDGYVAGATVFVDMNWSLAWEQGEPKTTTDANGNYQFTLNDFVSFPCYQSPAYHHTYGLPVLTTNCSNNYGPFHFPEKLIPLTIVKALAGEGLPVYGDGRQIRDWLYVQDHCAAICCVLGKGRPGEVYNIGGWNEKTNLDTVYAVCDLLDELHPRKDLISYRKQITFVADRPGHDRRYAVDASKVGCELGWKPVESFETGIRKTVQWYLQNQDWVASVQSGAYREWMEQNYTGRAKSE